MVQIILPNKMSEYSCNNDFYGGETNNMKRVCKNCGCEVNEEVEKELRKEYLYYCPECDENMYSFEVEEIPETMEEHKHWD